MQGIKVLIVDDHDDFRQAVRKHLEHQDFQFDIAEADCGEIGVAMALHRVPDIVLMDIRLPGITGIEAASQIKHQLPNSEIIFLTMFETDAFKEVFHSDAASDYIGKSELYAKLVPTIKRVLHKN